VRVSERIRHSRQPCHTCRDGHATGVWSEEVTGPYYVFTEAGCEVSLASVKGGKVPVDQFSLAEGFKTENDTKWEAEGNNSKFDVVPAISTLTPDDFDCIFLAGGHGTCVDFADGAAEICTKAYAAGKVVAAVCHGPFGLTKAMDGDAPLVKGKKVCGFSNEEEQAVIGMRKFDPEPPSLEDALKGAGGDYQVGEGMFQPNSVRDGKLVTGQNPASSVGVAKLAIEAMA